MRNRTTEEKRKYILEQFEEGEFFPNITEIDRILSSDDPDEQFIERTDKMYDLAVRKVKHYDMAFCMMDILGFGQMLLENTNAKVGFFYEKVLPLLETGIVEGKWSAGLMKTMNRGWFKLYKDKAEGSKDKCPELDVITFSDTILIYPKLSANTHRAYFDHPLAQIEMIVWAVKYLFVRMINEEILLRGSIGFGNCFIAREPLSYLGATIIEVHGTEEIQNWGGIMFAPSAAKLIEEGDNRGLKFHGIVEYDVPIKKDEASQQKFKKLFGKAGSKKYAVDWPLLVDSDIASMDWIDSQINTIRSRKVNQLYKHTREFYDCRSCLPK